MHESDRLLEILVPIWLTIVAIPYLHMVALYAIHETTLVRMRTFSSARHKNRGHKGKLIAILLRAGLSTRTARIIGDYATIIVETDGFRAAWRETENAIRKNRRQINAERVAQLRLTQNAGMVGVYQDGKQLDQREHAETKEALDWLWNCQVGHYRKLHRYRDDKVFASIIEVTSKDNGLPVPTDIKLHVSTDGQRWYAERETITGHWFAIGAAKPPVDQWFYDGAEKPTGFPNEHEWDQRIRGDQHSVNWE